MIPQTPTLLNVTAQTGATSTGAGSQSKWMAVPSKTRRTHIPINISQSGTSATWVVEGRNSPDDTATQLATGTVGDVAVVARMNYLRVRLTAATAATVRATSDVLLKATE